MTLVHLFLPGMDCLYTIETLQEAAQFLIKSLSPRFTKHNNQCSIIIELSKPSFCKHYCYLWEAALSTVSSRYLSLQETYEHDSSCQGLEILGVFLYDDFVQRSGNANSIQRGDCSGFSGSSYLESTVFAMVSDSSSLEFMVFLNFILVKSWTHFKSTFVSSTNIFIFHSQDYNCWWLPSYLDFM